MMIKTQRKKTGGLVQQPGAPHAIQLIKLKIAAKVRDFNCITLFNLMRINGTYKRTTILFDFCYI